MESVAGHARRAGARSCFCLAVVSLLALGLAAPQAESGSAISASRPSILLLSIDTLRADQLGLYGYPRPTDPALARAVGSFTLFTAAFTPIPLTVPAHASLLTGLHPRELGLLNNRQGLAPDHPGATLAQRLKAAGYRTAAVVGSGVLAGGPTGLGRGFDIYLDPAPGEATTRRTAAEVNAAVAPLLEMGEEPLFLMVHYYDVHEPYIVPDRLACLLRADPVLEDVLQQRRLRGVAYSKVLNRRRTEPLRRQGSEITLREMVAQYDAAVRLATDQAALLLEMWDASRSGPESLVIVTSDHGEGLGQHGYWSHGMNLFDENLRVPLLVRWPAAPRASRRQLGQVSLLDVVPTVLAAAGLEAPQDLPGRDLRQVVAAGGDVARQPLVAQRMRYVPAQRPPGLRNWRAGDGFAVLDGPLKYIEEEEGPPTLYDRAADPLEENDLLRRLPGRRAQFHNVLAAWIARYPDRLVWPPQAVDPERVRILRSLGYVDR
ncbi:MAG: sulfatase [Acidobacteria bacterium]|nr:sulfatase [Acidobacteriota bacterium]